MPLTYTEMAERKKIGTHQGRRKFKAKLCNNVTLGIFPILDALTTITHITLKTHSASSN